MHASPAATFMNRSGDAVAALSRYYDIAIADLLVVVDEVALPFGRLRARARGSAGGHNGLKSCIERLGTNEFPGFGWGGARRFAERPRGSRALEVRGDEQSALGEFIARAADAPRCLPRKASRR